VFVPFETAALVTGALLLVLFPILYDDFVRRWRAAGREDARWAEARRELGEAAEEICALDTRFLRPWGASTACQAFAVIARGAGHGWLEPVAARFVEATPFGMRAVAAELEGTKVAFLVIRTRRTEVVARRLAVGAAGVVEEDAGACDAPPEGFARDLEALARRVAVAA